MALDTFKYLSKSFLEMKMKKKCLYSAKGFKECLNFSKNVCKKLFLSDESNTYEMF